MADGPLALVISAPGRNVGNQRSRKLNFKIATMAIGVLMGMCALAGVVLAVALLFTKMEPLKELANALDFSFICKGNSSLTTPPPTQPPALHADVTTTKKELTIETFVAAIGVLIITMGIPNIIHFIMSVQLVYGAFKEYRNLVVQWIFYTQKTTVVHFFLTSFIAVGLFAVEQNLLGFALVVILLLITGIIVFFLFIVDQYNCMLHSRPSHTFLFKKKMVLSNNI